MMNNIVLSETLYTYDAAINRYEEERHHSWLCRQKQLAEIRKEQKERRKYFCNQNLYGVLAVITSFLLLFLTHEALLISAVGAGIYMMFTKKMLIYNEYYRTHGGSDQWKGR